jgi:hypothetical protein
MFSQLLTELRQNIRLRVGVWLIIVILMSYTILRLNDYNKRLYQEYQEAAIHLNHLQTVANQTYWEERSQQALNSRYHLEGRLWEASTKGLAQATFQKWLNTQLTKAKIDENVNLKVDRAKDVANVANVWQVTAKLEANFEAKNFNLLLAALTKNLQLTTIERLNIRLIRKRLKFSLIIVAFFQAVADS